MHSAIYTGIWTSFSPSSYESRKEILVVIGILRTHSFVLVVHKHICMFLIFFDCFVFLKLPDPHSCIAVSSTVIEDHVQ